MMNKYCVDVVVLTRDRSSVREVIRKALNAQRDVDLRIHRVVGHAEPSDNDRLDAICRARNVGKLRGESPWLMFLDDDVVLSPSCISTLVAALSKRVGYGALAADYLAQSCSDGQCRHVGMGATLFRRAALDRIRFRYDDARCECQCCCDDLRGLGYRVGYAPQARAMHLKTVQSPALTSDDAPDRRPSSESTTRHILTCFDWHHVNLFRNMFLPSLRISGNREVVHAVTFGLRPGQRELLANLPGVNVVDYRGQREHPAIFRLHAFRDILRKLPQDDLAACWDAGDTLFQAPLTELWKSVAHRGRDRLCVVAETNGVNRVAVREWAALIADNTSRALVYHTLKDKPMINGGFSAGSVRTMEAYFATSSQLVNSKLLRGSGGYDQNALNLYCHYLRRPHHYLDESWNFCLYGRPRGSVAFDDNLQLVHRRNNSSSVIPVVHGNARTLYDCHEVIFDALKRRERSSFHRTDALQGVNATIKFGM